MGRVEWRRVKVIRNVGGVGDALGTDTTIDRAADYNLRSGSSSGNLCPSPSPAVTW